MSIENPRSKFQLFNFKSFGGPGYILLKDNITIVNEKEDQNRLKISVLAERSPTLQRVIVDSLDLDLESRFYVPLLTLS